MASRDSLFKYVPSIEHFVELSGSAILARPRRGFRPSLAGMLLLVVLGPLAVLAASPAKSAPSGDSAIFFTGEVNGNADLYRLLIPSMKVTPLTRAPSQEIQPAIAPDEKRLAFISDKSGANSLYMVDLENPTATWTNLSIGIGAHANPAFSPDGAQLAFSYAPDPEEPLKNTRLMVLDLKTKKATAILDSVNWPSAKEARAYRVVDRPQWIDVENLVFVAIDYSDDEARRITSSGIHRLHLPDGKTTHLAGGESYFSAEGKPQGYRATMPRSTGKSMTFVAVEGQFNRTPMVMTADGKNKRVLPIQDADFFGPALPLGKDFLYVFQDQDGKTGLALQTPPDKVRKAISFAGTAMDPVLHP